MKSAKPLTWDELRTACEAAAARVAAWPQWKRDVARRILGGNIDDPEAN